MENYFQIRSIPYVRTVDAYPAFERKMEKMVGIHQMPAVVLSDGRWMIIHLPSDNTTAGI